MENYQPPPLNCRFDGGISVLVPLLLVVPLVTLVVPVAPLVVPPPGVLVVVPLALLVVPLAPPLVFVLLMPLTRGCG